MVRYSAVYGAYAGSIPVRRAKSHEESHGVKLDWSTEGGLSSRYRPVRFRLALPKFRASSLIGEALGS